MLADASRSSPLRHGRRVGDIIQALARLNGRTCDAVLADTACDGNARRATIAAAVVVPPRRTRGIVIPHAALSCKCRNRVERCLRELKRFRRFATATTDGRHFTGLIQLAAPSIWILDRRGFGRLSLIARVKGRQ